MIEENEKNASICESILIENNDFLNSETFKTYSTINKDELDNYTDHNTQNNKPFEMKINYIDSNEELKIQNSDQSKQKEMNSSEILSEFYFTEDKEFQNFFNKNKEFFQGLKTKLVLFINLIKFQNEMIEENAKMEKHLKSIKEKFKEFNELNERKKFILDCKVLKSALVYLEDTEKKGKKLHLCSMNCHTFCSGIAIEQKIHENLEKIPMPEKFDEIEFDNKVYLEGYVCHNNVEIRVMKINNTYDYFKMIIRNKDEILKILSENTDDKNMIKEIEELSKSKAYYSDLIKFMKKITLNDNQYDKISSPFINMYIDDMFNRYEETFYLSINMFFPILSTYYQNGKLIKTYKTVTTFINSKKTQDDYDIFFKDIYSKNFDYITRNIKESIISSNQLQLEFIAKIFFEKHNLELVKQELKFEKSIQSKLVYLRMKYTNLSNKDLGLVKLMYEAKKSEESKIILEEKLDKLISSEKEIIDMFKKLIEVDHNPTNTGIIGRYCNIF